MRRRRDPASLDAISKRLRVLRRAIAIKDKVPPEFITQAKMAKDAGVTTNAWNNYERDPLARIGIDSARALKRIYGVSLDWIYEGEMDGLKKALKNAILEAERQIEAEDAAAGVVTTRRDFLFLHKTPQ